MQAVRQLPGLPVLDPLEERLLNQLASRWHEGARVTVMEAMQSARDASPSTVHRRLISLRRKGVIQLMADSRDERLRYIEPTEAAVAYFDEMGRCIERALSS